MKITAKLAQLLNDRGLELSVAESFTGGAVCAAITSVPGASKYFTQGIICYSNEAKRDRLGVNPETISAFGAVSRETAMEMLRGLKTYYGIATTGNAGPLSEKAGDVGHCFIGVKIGEILEVFEYQFKGSRKKVISLGKNAAINGLYNSILKAD